MRTTNKIGFLFLINAHPHVICLHVWEGRFYLGVRMLWHTWTVQHLHRAVRVQCSALVRCSGRGALAQPLGNAAPGPAHVLPTLTQHAGEPCGVRGSPASRGKAWPAAPAAAGRLSPPAQYHSRQRPPGWGSAELPSGPGAARRGSACGAVLGPDGAGARGPSRALPAGPAALSAATPALRPAPSSALPPSSGRPCPSPLFSPKANGDEMQRVGPGRTRRGRSVRPQSPPLAR